MDLGEKRGLQLYSRGWELEELPGREGAATVTSMGVWGRTESSPTLICLFGFFSFCRRTSYTLA